MIIRNRSWGAIKLFLVSLGCGVLRDHVTYVMFYKDDGPCVVALKRF